MQRTDARIGGSWPPACGALLARYLARPSGPGSTCRGGIWPARVPALGGLTWGS